MGLFSRDYVDVYLLIELNSSEASSEFLSPAGSTFCTDVNRWDGIGYWKAQKHYRIQLRLVCKHIPTHRSAVVKNLLVFWYSAQQAGISTAPLILQG